MLGAVADRQHRQKTHNASLLDRQAIILKDRWCYRARRQTWGIRRDQFKRGVSVLTADLTLGTVAIRSPRAKQRDIPTSGGWLAYPVWRRRDYPSS